MINIKRFMAVLGVIVLVVGSYVGWQLYKGQQMANQYAADAQKLAQGLGDTPTSGNSQTPSSNGTTPAPSSDQASPSQASPPPSSSTPSSGEYKILMSTPYKQSLQAMHNAKSSALALQGGNMSLSAYKASTLQAQATFSSAEAFVRAHPPTDENLNASYQEFLAGISLAQQSMGVVLNGISSLNPSKFYTARDMGTKAQQQIIEAYAKF
ncbi:MAG TPA: hypothetical protein VN456_14955 [Desulfosporosinus sp.]|nr:hypothetical protein [Desulfosporosinus sp.]